MSGSLPAWMGRDKERKRVNKRSQRFEQGLAKEVGGKVQPGSGSSHRAPQDVVGPEHLIQHKFTDKSSYRITTAEWREVAADALRHGREPLLVIDFARDGLRLVISDTLPGGG